jgi:hypothetical protein
VFPHHQPAAGLAVISANPTQARLHWRWHLTERCNSRSGRNHFPLTRGTRRRGDGKDRRHTYDVAGTFTTTHGDGQRQCNVHGIGDRCRFQ